MVDSTFATESDKKAEMYSSIEGSAEVYWDTAATIWGLAEPGYQEHQSSRLLSQILSRAGFKIEFGVADMPTGFTATFGSGKPVIGVLGEFDALPGLSQEVDTKRNVGDNPSGYGHACGHHLFGVASAAAAIAIGQEIQKGTLAGTVRFYGTPAEEGGSAKAYMARDGLFEDCDAVLHWHPGDRNAAGDPTNMARIAAKFRFFGKSAHAAGAPEQGRSALDAVELTNYAAQLLREHTPDFTRIHHVITAGGGAPNVVPDFAEAFYYARHPDAATVQKIYKRLVKCAEAGAHGTETRLEIENLGGTYNLLPNDTLAKVTLKNLKDLANLSYTNKEREFAEAIQKTLEFPRPLETIVEVYDMSGKVSKGSTDVGDVSWLVPTSGFRTATWVPGTPAHSWQAVAAGGMSLGRNGMLLAAKVLAATAWDLFRDPQILAAAKSELDRRRSGASYQPMIEKGRKPPLHYRSKPTAEGAGSKEAQGK